MRRKRPSAEFSLQLLPEDAKSGTAIEDVDTLSGTDFDAGGVPSVAHILGLWAGRRTAYAPELDPHRLGLHRGPTAAVSLVSSDDNEPTSIAGMVPVT